jgi:hypothetical protein
MKIFFGMGNRQTTLPLVKKQLLEYGLPIYLLLSTIGNIFNYLGIKSIYDIKQMIFNIIVLFF